jgi:hypothetical protein
MLRTSGPPAIPEIQRAVDGLLSEDSNFDRLENRSAHRDNLVRPVNIEFRDSNATISAFSRNVSATGIGVITNQPIDDKSAAVLQITRLHDSEVSILAECRWCKPYGKNWYISGWQFISLKR